MELLCPLPTHDIVGYLGGIVDVFLPPRKSLRRSRTLEKTQGEHLEGKQSHFERYQTFSTCVMQLLSTYLPTYLPTYRYYLVLFIYYLQSTLLRAAVTAYPNSSVLTFYYWFLQNQPVPYKTRMSCEAEPRPSLLCKIRRRNNKIMPCHWNVHTYSYHSYHI